jgi:transposase
MAYQEHGMWEVLDVLKRIHRGESVREVAKATGRTRKTVTRYIQTAASIGWVKGLHAPDEDLAAEVIARLKPGPKDAVAETEALLAPLKDQIREWLAPEEYYQRGLRLTKVRTLLERRNVKVSYSALYRFACKHFDFGRSASTVRVADVAPGELAEVDFGRLGLVHDPETGGRRVLHALVVTLVFSRHQYVHVTHSQKLADLIDGLEDAWAYFGGVPARVVIDNLKAAVTKADRYEPELARTFNEYADYRGFVIDAAVVRHPTGKPHVERQVQYVRDNFFRGEQWLGLEHVQRAAVDWCTSTAGERIHGTTRKQPRVEFVRFEKAALKPLAEGRFDTPSWGEPKVHPDQHVRFGLALYSVPHQHRGTLTKGKKVTVRGDRMLVRIYLRGELLKTHPRQPPGGRHTDFGDYPPEKTPYAMRDANYLIGKAKDRGPAIGRFTTQLLSGDFPWAKLRQAQALLRLVDKYGAERVDPACNRALGFGLVNTKRVERIVLQAIEDDARRDETDRAGGGTLVQLPLRFLRPPDSLNHQPQQEKQEHGNPTLP